VRAASTSSRSKSARQGRYSLGIEPEGAESVTEVGKYIVVHQPQADGSTKIVFDIFNSNALD
jgi:hypothetical protein